MHRTSLPPCTGGLLSTATSRPAGGSTCLTIVSAGEIRLWVAMEATDPAAAACAPLHTRGRARQAGHPFRGRFSMAAAERQVSAAFLSGTAEPGRLARRSKEQGEGRARGDGAGSC